MMGTYAPMMIEMNIVGKISEGDEACLKRATEIIRDMGTELRYLKENGHYAFCDRIEMPKAVEELLVHALMMYPYTKFD